MIKTLKLLIRKNLEKYYLRKIFMLEAYHFFKLLVKYNASINTDRDIAKMQYTLLRENHTIEKGLSMRNPRKGFGQKKVLNLLIRLDKYVTLYYNKDKEFVDYLLSTIHYYITYTKQTGVDISDIELKFNTLLNRLDNHTYKNIVSGIKPETKEHILSECNKNFESLLYSRHSLRYFENTLLTKEVLEKALSLAQQTPSACNRQGWKTHIFQGENSHKLIEWQGGCHGFEDQVNTSILVTTDLRAFLFYEVHQAYVDGGLYAMNLINALHSLGIGTIPLSVAFGYDKLDNLSQFDIPRNEIPIVIIGAGYILDNFNVAVSSRKSINRTNKYH